METVLTPQRTRRWGTGTAAVVRLLIWSDRPQSGAAIARAVGITQPRAVQVLAMLAGRDGVKSGPEGFQGEPSVLLELYRLRTKPSVATESHWYSTKPQLEQAKAVTVAASLPDSTIGFSADLGPDLLAPWRHPTQSVVYTTDALDLGNAGFVSAEGIADASLIVRHVDHNRLFGPSTRWPRKVDGVLLVDPIQQWWDLHHLGGEDRLEAAEHLRRAILDRRIRT